MTNLKKITPVDAEVVEQTKEIIPQENQIVNVENLIGQAIAQKLPVETMERFFALAKEMQAIKAKQEFDKAMANFQAECPTIKKTKAGGTTNSGQVAYYYAPIESIVQQVAPFLQKNGFSYSTDMELLTAGVKVTVKVTHLAGHSEFSTMNVPLGTQTKVMSASQQVAAAQTFAKRYAFLNAFGIMTGDEDNDGANLQIDKEQPQYTHDGNIVETPRQTKDVPASEKQLKLIADLMHQKGYTKEDILNQGFTKLTGGKEGTASELIDFLFKAKTKVTPKGDELPVIQVSEEEQALIDQVPF